MIILLYMDRGTLNKILALMGKDQNALDYEPVSDDGETHIIIETPTEDVFVSASQLEKYRQQIKLDDIDMPNDLRQKIYQALGI